MWKRSPRPAPTKDPPTFAARRSPWHAVAIVSSVSACPEVVGLLGTRFLSKEAPCLPLKNCSMSGHCRCAYQHHDDRRGLSRRTKDHWNPGRSGYGGEERRREPGRRVTDYP